MTPRRKRSHKQTPPRPEGTERWWTITEVAGILRCSQQVVRRLIRKGVLPVMKIGDAGRIWRVPDSALRALAAAKGRGA